MRGSGAVEVDSGAPGSKDDEPKDGRLRYVSYDLLMSLKGLTWLEEGREALEMIFF